MNFPKGKRCGSPGMVLPGEQKEPPSEEKVGSPEKAGILGEQKEPPG